MAPKYFWITLLIDALPFLADNVSETIHDSPGVYFSSEQTYELMQCLHDLQNEKELPAKQKLLLEQYEVELRRRFANNLAVALMQENDNSVNNVAKTTVSIPAFWNTM